MRGAAAQISRRGKRNSGGGATNSRRYATRIVRDGAQTVQDYSGCEHDVSGISAPEIIPKKKSLHASQRETPRVKRQRTQFKKTIAPFDVTRLKFLDETSVNLSFTRLYGRAAPNQRVVASTPQPSGPSLTLLAVVGWNGLTAPLVVPGAITGAIFSSYLAQCVAPTLRRGDVLLMDNLSAHKVSGVEAVVQARGAHLMYLPPYSPDLNPIELVWSKGKTLLRGLQARTFATLLPALKQALLAITTQDIHGWFAHCGYAIN